MRERIRLLMMENRSTELRNIGFPDLRVLADECADEQNDRFSKVENLVQKINEIKEQIPNPQLIWIAVT